MSVEQRQRRGRARIVGRVEPTFYMPAFVLSWLVTAAEGAGQSSAAYLRGLILATDFATGDPQQRDWLLEGKQPVVFNAAEYEWLDQARKTAAYLELSPMVLERVILPAYLAANSDADEQAMRHARQRPLSLSECEALQELAAAGAAGLTGGQRKTTSQTLYRLGLAERAYEERQPGQPGRGRYRYYLSDLGRERLTDCQPPTRS